MADSTEKKALSKAALIGEIADRTGLTRRQVTEVFDVLPLVIQKEVGPDGPGLFTLPGLLKFVRVHKPAVKGGPRPNPFKPGEMMVTKDKPETIVIKLRALKGLKNMA